MFDIISFGEYHMLQQALNGLAAITASSSFTQMVRAGFIVGIIAFGARVVMTNRWDALTLFTGFVAYSLMFVPKVDVTITDAYGRGIVVVGNVPIGLAAPLSITSHAGRYLATTFESAFSTITSDSSIAVNGYLDPLTVLLKLRDGSFGTANSDNNANGDFQKSLSSYIVGCVQYDINLDDGSDHEVTEEKLKKAPNTLAAMKTTFVNISVQTWIPNVDPPEGAFHTCEEAYTKISEAIDNTNFVDVYFDAYVKSKLPVAVNPNATTAKMRVESALSAIQQSSGDAQRFMVNTLMADLLRRAKAGYALSTGDTQAAIISTTAMQQRNVEWAAEKSQFEKIARPLIAFMEVFVVCAGPIMAFIIAAFGTGGLNILVSFLVTHVWICLWMPTLAICNLYLYTQITRYVDQVTSSSGADILSYGSLDDTFAQIQNWVAVGGMLAAATPILAGMMLWGAKSGAQALANRFSTSGHIDPTNAAPQVVRSAPYVQNEPSYVGTPGQVSYTQKGMAEQTFSLGGTLVQQVASAKNLMEATQKTADELLSRNVSNVIGAGETISVNKDGTIRSTGEKGQAFAAVFNEVMATNEARSMDRGAAQQLAYALSANAGAAFGFGTGNIPGIRANFSSGFLADIQSKSGISATQIQRVMTQVGENASSSRDVGARLTDAVSRSTSFLNSGTFNRSDSDNATQQWATAIRQSQQASQSFLVASQANSVVSSNTSGNLAQWGTTLSNKLGEGWDSALLGSFRKNSFGGNVETQDRSLQSAASNPIFQAQTASITNQSQRLALAALFVMQNEQSANAAIVIGNLAGSTSRALQGLSAHDSERNSQLATVASGISTQFTDAVTSNVDSLRTSGVTPRLAGAQASAAAADATREKLSPQAKFKRASQDVADTNTSNKADTGAIDEGRIEVFVRARPLSFGARISLKEALDAAGNEELRAAVARSPDRDK